MNYNKKKEEKFEKNENKIIAIKENNKQSNIEKILQNWSILQKDIKEGVILKKVIIEQQKTDITKLKTKILEYYDIKLKIRETYEEIETLKNQKINNKQIIFEKNVDYNNKIKCITELLFIFRNNYDYIIKLSEIIELNNNNNENEYIFNSIIKLFCNQFYDNILIPNPEQEELLILVYKLIEKNISNMNNPFLDIFLIKETFLSKFIKYLMRKSDIKTFLSKLLGNLILDIEEFCNDLDLTLYEYENEENNKEENEIFMNYITKIKNKKENINISEDKIKEKIEKLNDNDLKNFYNFFLYKNINNLQKNNFCKLWSNDISLCDILDNVNENEQKSLIKLKNNFLLIKSKIDYLLQSLLEKISAGPYIIKCICKIIYLLISNKFPSELNYIYLSFIGKFIFENCIFPVLNFDSDNSIDNRIYNSNTKHFLKIISDILDKAINYKLFLEEKTPFQILLNYYFIEIIPLFGEIYKKLIYVRLPNFLNNLIEKKSSKNINYKNEYFKYNTDEIIFLQSICISVDDILFILDIISKNKNFFENLKDYKNFEKLLNNINKTCEKDIVSIMSNPKKNLFFVLFNKIYKTKIEKAFKYYNKTRKSSTLLLKNEEKMNYKRIKICIKKALKNIGDISSKSNTFLNFVTSNNKFLESIKLSLDDTEDIQIINSEKNINKNKKTHIIPLKWYGQYINNNINSLDISYKENDFKKLYKEILKEELENLEKLKLYSEIIIVRDGMNLICCEKIIEKIKNELIKCEISKKFIKIEKFIDTQKIEVCIRIKNEELKKEIKSKKKKIKKQKKEDIEIFLDENPPDIILSEDFILCNHKKLEEIECLILKNRKVIPSHSHDIKEFIQKFSDNPWGIDRLNIDKKPKDIIINEIQKGTRNSQIYRTIDDYMTLIKKRIKKKGEIDDIIQIIQNFIYRQIHKYIFPKIILKEDIDFYNKTLILDWITPENLEIQKFYVDQLTDVELCIQKFDKAESIFDKLNCVKDAFTNINNNIKYSSGKNDEAGQDEILPIFQYILIRSCPKRMKTNLNYINCFLSEDDYNSQFGYFVSQLESSFTFIMKLGYKELNISKDIYEQNIENAKKRYNI